MNKFLRLAVQSTLSIAALTGSGHCIEDELYYHSSWVWLDYQSPTVHTTYQTNYSYRTIGRLNGVAVGNYSATGSIAQGPQSVSSAAAIADTYAHLLSMGGPGTQFSSVVNIAHNATSLTTSTHLWSMASRKYINTLEYTSVYNYDLMGDGFYLVNGVLQPSGFNCIDMLDHKLPTSIGEPHCNWKNMPTYTEGQRAWLWTDAYMVVIAHDITNFTSSAVSETNVVDATIANVATVQTVVGPAYNEYARNFQRRMLANIVGTDGDAAAIRPESANSYVFGRLALWADGFDTWSNEKIGNGVEGNDRSTHGYTLGASYNVLPGLTAGVAVEQGWGKLSVHHTAEDADTEITQVGLSAAYVYGDLLASVGGTYGSGKADTHRTFDGWSTATASPRYTVWGATAQLGYRWNVGGLSLVPEAIGNWSTSRRGASVETGGTWVDDPSYSNLALAYPKLATDYGEVALGVRGFGTMNWDSTQWTFSGHLYATDLFTGADPNVVASLQAYPDVLIPNSGVLSKRYGVDFGAAISVQVWSSLSLRVGADILSRGSYTSKEASAGLRIAL